MAHQSDVNKYRYSGRCSNRDGAILMYVAHRRKMSVSNLINFLIASGVGKLWGEMSCEERDAVCDIQDSILMRNKVIREKYDKLTRAGFYRRKGYAKG